MKKILIGAVILLVIVVVAVLFLRKPSVTLVPNAIGGFLPMTGAVAAYGQDAKAGIEIAMEMKPEVLGKKLNFVVADTKSDKIEAANAMSRLIERDKVFAVIGEMISGNTMAGAPIAEKAMIPVVSPTATNPLVT